MNTAGTSPSWVYSLRIRLIALTGSPGMGETILGKGFALGPGGKGSNQAVAVARLGSPVSFISRVGDDAFAKMAREMWVAEGVNPLVESDPNSFTGAAYIFIDDKSGDNAIIVVPGAARDIGPEDLERNRDQALKTRASS